ncbi:uncharacterized protein LOC123532238 [Mercenaria mercenaria]|uniref:uncharacterized protein LOC123532238 n=1 Tax=Mercenaria mercenaria TaxID=6596 RepID=UPI00234F91E0|nr:uncharacterized protein LOC123532238 [Mercenaria mercenaria]
MRKRSLDLTGIEEDTFESDTESSSKKIQLQPKKKLKQIHIPWTVKEKEALFESFGDYLEGKSVQLPGKAAVEVSQSKYAVLKGRTWLNIKFQVKNIRSKFWKK